MGSVLKSIGFIVVVAILAPLVAVFAIIGNLTSQCIPMAGVSVAPFSSGERLPDLKPSQRKIAETAVGVAFAHTELSTELRLKLAKTLFVVGEVETNFTNYKTATDATSLGVVAQQAWWGTAEQRTHTPTAFEMLASGGAKLTQEFNGHPDTEEPGILDIKGWENLPVGDVAWKVQLPDERYRGRYAEHVSRAEEFIGPSPSMPTEKPSAEQSAGSCSNNDTPTDKLPAPPKGYPNTAGQSCGGGTTTAGTARTAKGNVIQLCSINGIKINASFSDRFGRMVQAASQDGITIRGGGFRTAEEQIAVRRKNCGTSLWAIYRMPSKACSPDTAKPGESQHEQGGAADVKLGRGVFAWLTKFAKKYSIFNLDSERWHWSWNGR